MTFGNQKGSYERNRALSSSSQIMGLLKDHGELWQTTYFTVIKGSHVWEDPEDGVRQRNKTFFHDRRKAWFNESFYHSLHKDFQVTVFFFFFFKVYTIAKCDTKCLWLFSLHLFLCFILPTKPLCCKGENIFKKIILFFFLFLHKEAL